MRNRRVSSLLAKKIGVFWVIASVLLSAGVSYAIASNITVTTTTYSQILGSYISTTGSLSATDSGVAAAALPTSGQEEPHPVRLSHSGLHLEPHRPE